MSCTYVVIYNGRQAEVEAADLWSAKVKGAEILRVPKSRQGLLGVYLAKDSNGDPVNILPQLP